MSEQNLEQTQPTIPADQQGSPSSGNDTKQKSKTWIWIVGGLLAIILVSALGGLGGYYAGIQDRKAVETNQRDLAASMQYQLGLADLEAGRYSFAKQRFEYVIQLNPAYPGVLENMAKLTIILNATATPTVMPTLTPAPTLDLSGVEALLMQAKQMLAAGDYNGTIIALDSLRKENITFKTMEVDGLYYKALSKRGVQKITSGSLEGGLYDFAVMRNYGPQDKDSKDMSEWAVMYISAARYFGWDWENAVKYLGEIYQYIPTLIDSSNRSVADRYRESLGRYGDVLAKKEQWCKAVPYYEQSLALGANQAFDDAYTKAYNKCQASLPTAAPTEDPTVPTEAPTEETPVVEEPTEAPTEEVTPPEGG